MASLSTAVMLVLALSTSLAFPQRPLASYNSQTTASSPQQYSPVGYYLVPMHGGGRMGSYPQFGSPYRIQQQPQYVLLNPGGFAQQYNPAQNRMDAQNPEVHKLRTLFPYLVNAFVLMQPTVPLFLINPPYRPNKPINLSYRPDKPNRPFPGHLTNLPYYTTQRATGPTLVPVEFEGVPATDPTPPFISFTTPDTPDPLEVEATPTTTPFSTDTSDPTTTQRPESTDYEPTEVHHSYPPHSKPITTTRRPNPTDEPIGVHLSYPPYSKPVTTTDRPFPTEEPIGVYLSYPPYSKPITTTVIPYHKDKEQIGGHLSYPPYPRPITTTRRPYPEHYWPPTTTRRPYFNHGTASWDHTSTQATTVDINWEQWDEGRKPTNVRGKPGSPKDAQQDTAESQSISEAGQPQVPLVNNPSNGPVYIVLGQMPQMGYYDLMDQSYIQQLGASNYLPGQQQQQGANSRSGYGGQNGNHFVPFRPASHYRSTHTPVSGRSQKPLVGLSYAYPNLFTRQQSYDDNDGGYEDDEGVVVDATEVRRASAGDKTAAEKGERVDSEKVEAAGPAGPSVAQAKPQAIAMAGPGGVAAATPMATAVVGPGGMAVAAPSATAVAGPSGGKPPISVGSNAALTAAYKAQMKAERKQDQFSAVSLGGRLVSPVGTGESDGMYGYGI